MPDVWSRVKRLVSEIDTRVQRKMSTEVCMRELIKAMGPDHDLEQPVGYAWLSLYSNYLRDADKVVIACGPRGVPSLRPVSSHVSAAFWRPALEVLDRVGVSDLFTHRRAIVDIKDGKVHRVHVPPNLRTSFQHALLHGKNACDSLWVRLDDYNTLYPVAFALIDGSMHVYDSDGAFPTPESAFTALRCVSGYPCSGVWSSSGHQYRTCMIDLPDTMEAASVSDTSWRSYGRHSSVLSRIPAHEKVHNGTKFRWSPTCGAYLSGDGPLAHGLSILSSRSCISDERPVMSNVYFPLAAMYRYYSEVSPRGNAGNMATRLYLNSV